MTLPSDEELAEIVVLSNAIEKVVEGPGHSLFDDHFTAAVMVRDAVKPLSLREIHRVLMRRQLPDAGRYREGEVAIFSKYSPPKPMPRASVVPRLMVELEGMVMEAIAVCENVARDPMACAVMARVLHAHALCIHPFSDGNGRATRLWWNQFRQRFGLPWQGIALDGHQEYYQSIQRYEADVFRPRYPNVY